MQRELFWGWSELQSSWEPFEVIIERSRSLWDRDAPSDPSASCTCLRGGGEGGDAIKPLSSNYSQLPLG